MNDIFTAWEEAEKNGVELALGYGMLIGLAVVVATVAIIGGVYLVDHCYKKNREYRSIQDGHDRDSHQAFRLTSHGTAINSPAPADEEGGVPLTSYYGAGS